MYEIVNIFAGAEHRFKIELIPSRIIIYYMNLLEKAVRDSDEMCLRLWGLTACEVSDIRLISGYADELRAISNLDPTKLNTHKPFRDFLPNNQVKSLFRLGALLLRKKRLSKNQLVDLELLQRCLDSPCFKDCVDPN